MNHSASKVAVIGAGPAGATAAYQLTKAGVSVDLYESSNCAGGMARTIELWDQRVDIGPHRFFSADRRVNDVWLDVVGDDFEMVKRLTRVFYGGKFYHYPLKPVDTLRKLGPIEAARCFASYAAGKFENGATSDDSFEDWVTDRFGRRLFEIFFKTYSEKLWGIPCKDLDADFAAQRIKKFSLGEALKTALLPGKSSHKTLVDEFAYPHGGTGTVYERMAGYVESHGGRVLYGTPVKRVLTTADRVNGLELYNGEIHHYDEVISSMPLTQLVNCFEDAPTVVRDSVSHLGFRNTVLAYLHIDSEDLFPDNWLYVHSPDLRMGRITNFRNWIPQINGTSRRTILASEYWCYNGDELWRQDDNEIIRLASEEMRRTGLIGNARIDAGKILRVPRCYPVYRTGYKKHLLPVERYLRSIEGLSVIGRYGAFKYNNQDHSILMGRLAAENIAEGTTHDLWAINTDYDSYQEEATISKAGIGQQSMDYPPPRAVVA
jgi:protoporphyrinogen oxidase